MNGGLQMKKEILLSSLKLVLLAITLSLCLAQLPLTAMAADGQAAQTALEDGEYSIDVKFEGGSGKSTVESPATLIVRDGRAFARIVWSSPNYDYMKVGGEKYLPVNEDGNSAFEIPITAFDEPMAVIGDTTVMSTPHEVEYTLTFFEKSIASASGSSQTTVLVIVCAVVAAACAAAFFAVRKKRSAGK